MLVYYLIANASAFTQPRDQRRFPRVVQVTGAAGCTALAAILPFSAVVAGLAVFVAGLLYRAVRLAVTASGTGRHP